MNTAWTLLKTTFKEWREDNATRLAAALSYYTAVAVAPLLIIVLSVASLFIDVQTVRQELSGQIHNVVGEQGGQILLNVLENADRPQAATLAGFFSFMVLLWGASNVFNQLQEALNTVWGVELKPETGIWTTVKKRFLSFGMILVIGFLLLVSLVLSTAIALLSNQFSNLLPGIDWIWNLVNLLFSLAIIILLFGLIYKVLPDVKIAWRDVWWGAFVTALLFVIGKYVLGLYLGIQSLDSAYGAAGSLIVFLIWVYFSAQIFFFGAEFTQVQARGRSGSGIEPAEKAQFIEAEQRR